MHHLILGYGYCGYYLSQELRHHNQQITTVSRHDRQVECPQLETHRIHDINQPLTWTTADTIVYYLIPPPSYGNQDDLLNQFLSDKRLKAKKVIYFSSSGVYGNHHNAWIDEQAPCLIENPRQQRRLDAEQQWQTYCQEQHIDLTILRVAGIYGPQQLPIAAAQQQTPIIEQEKAPFINHIYVKNLATIAYLLGQTTTPHLIYNVADGNPQPMGTLQQEVAKALHLPPAPEQPFADAWQSASPMKKEFMSGGKRLQVDRLTSTLGSTFSFTTMEEAIQDSLKKGCNSSIDKKI